MKKADAHALVEEYRNQCRQTIFFENIQATFRANRNWSAPGYRAAERNEKKSREKEIELEEKIVKALTR